MSGYWGLLLLFWGAPNMCLVCLSWHCAPAWSWSDFQAACEKINVFLLTPPTILHFCIETPKITYSLMQKKNPKEIVCEINHCVLSVYSATGVTCLLLSTVTWFISTPPRPSTTSSIWKVTAARSVQLDLVSTVSMQTVFQIMYKEMRVAVRGRGPEGHWWGSGRGFMFVYGSLQVGRRRSDCTCACAFVIQQAHVSSLDRISEGIY